MSGTLSRAAPIRFLIGVGIFWTVARGAVVMGWQPPEATAIRPIPVIWTAPDRHPATAGPPLLFPGRPVPVSRAAVIWPATQHSSISNALLRAARDPAAPSPTILAYAAARPGSTYREPAGTVEAGALLLLSHRSSRLTGSVWAFARGGGRARALSPDGQIGGGQAGARLFYRLDEAGRIAATARISTTIGGPRQSEASVGLDWKPVATLPVQVMVERRIAIDKGGRNAWTAGLAGGVYALPVAPGWRLDSYGEAGIVGAHRRDLYADGAARIGRVIDVGKGRSLTLGPGAWGAAQPGAARLDVGPSAVLRLPVEGRTVAISLDWRERVAGRARPGSGVALTVAADF